MAPSACCGDRTAARARRLLVVCCTVLAVYQCWTLLELYLSEPVSMSLSYTPETEVDVPAVTVCTRWRKEQGQEQRQEKRQQQRQGQGQEQQQEQRQQQRQEQRQEQERDLSPAQTAWLRADPLGAVVQDCSPGCSPTANISYPGGEVAVSLGTWSAWLSRALHMCYTLEPNATWGQLADAKRKHTPELRILLPEKPGASPDLLQWSYRLCIHRRGTRPLFTNLGIKHLRTDQPIKIGTSKVMNLYVSSYVHDKENLRRSRCNPAIGYSYETCMVHCSHQLWADKRNCSTPRMLQEFPHLRECTDEELDMKTPKLSERADLCGCLPGCRRHLYTIEAGVLGIRDRSDWSKIRLRPGQVAQQVARERRSYPPVSLVSEMGGYISLLLGVSVLSLADLAGEVLGWCRAALRTAPRPGGAGSIPTGAATQAWSN